MMTSIVLTVIGPDRPGLVSAVSDKPAACGEITTVSDSSITVGSGGKETSIPLSDIVEISAVSECE